MKGAELERSGRFLPVKRLYRIVMVSLAVATYVAMGPLGYLAFALLAVLPTRDRVRRAHRLQGIMRRAFALMHHWLRWVRVMDYNPRQIEGEVPDGPCVVIANHPALDDVTTIMSAIPRLCTAVNRRTFHRRWLRPLLEQAGQFSGGTETLLGTGEVLDRATERLRQGFRVLVFPEGHRSPRGRLRPFARGAFEIACRAGVAVVPILIHADPLWLARGDSVLAPPAELAKKRLKVLPPLQPADFDGDSRRMRAHAEAMYSRLLGARVFRPSLPPADSPVAEAPQPETGG